MERDEHPDGGTLEAEALRLPVQFDDAFHATAVDIDAFLAQDELPAARLEATVAAHREAGTAQLLTHRIKPRLDFELPLWPSSLYIPRDADYRDYWFLPAPDDHRYALDWTSPASATANRASRLDGTLFSFSQLRNDRAGTSQSSESGVGVYYRPAMSLGVIDLQPVVRCTGTLRTFLEFYPQLAAGSVEVKAHLLLAAWQRIPGGFDLLGFKSFAVATSFPRDQSHGPELRPFQRSFAGPSLSAPFVVQGGRTYLLGVLSRISVSSTLRSTTGGSLPAISNTELRVWGSMNCDVPQIEVLTKQVYIP
jgi:hypothetical protein